MDEQEIKDPEVQTEHCAQCDEYLNNWKRVQADYDNAKKQSSREKEEFAKYATFRAAETFLPAVDHFAEALRHEATEQNWKTWVAGVKFINKEFEAAMKELGLEKMEVVGKAFDPSLHESVGQRHEEGKPPGEILEEKKAGYQMQGKMLRPAQVIINQVNNE